MTAAVPSLGLRVVRSSAITVLGFGAAQAIRLLSNLLLTRLLFPEAFGMMALVSVFIMGLAMVSDLGFGPAIMGSRRGDDPPFLDTAWTLSILRGLVLWPVAAAAAWPMALFYGEPALAWYLPVAALSLIVSGFNPTRVETQNRHLRAGLVTLTELGAQGLGAAVTLLLAWWWRDVWALVVSGVLSALITCLAYHAVLPGHRERPRIEREAARELLRFGLWILLATLCGFLIGQADKAILGRLLDLDHFGLYNIAFFLASFPLMLGGVVARRVLIPVYRDSPPAASPANLARVRRLRGGALLVLLAGAGLLAFLGVPLVALLYDPRYQGAGAIVALVAAMQGPALLILSCDQAALAHGDSRRFFRLTLARALLVVAGILVGWQMGGLAGAIAGQAAANLLAYPVLAWLLRPHGDWDPLLDAGFLAAWAALAAAALWWNAAAVAAMP